MGSNANFISPFAVHKGHFNNLFFATDPVSMEFVSTLLKKSPYQ
jgi:hypothetical protein